MRTLRSPSFRLAWLLALAAPLSAAGGCKWTDFDDLEEETWVTATGKPENAAVSWAVSIARLDQGGSSGSGGTLAVLGSSESSYDEVVIGPNGDVNTQNERELNTDFAIGNLAIDPLFLSRPDGDEVALITGLDSTRGLVIRSIAGQLTPFPIMMAPQPSAATYMMSPPRVGVDPGPQVQILVAQAEAVFGVYFDTAKAPNPQTKCALRDEAMVTINIRALGAYRPPQADTDDVLVLTETGKLMAYPGSVFNGCGAGTQTPKPGFALNLMFPGVQSGAQILVFSDQTASYAVVQMRNDTGRGRVGLYRIDADSIDEIGAPRELDRIKTAALFQPTSDGKRYVLAGMPTTTVDGVAAGQVQAIEIDTTAGLAATPAMTLSDARPEDNQAFGRGVAALPYNGKTIIAVAADNEIFLYFRTTLYAETREGR